MKFFKILIVFCVMFVVSSCNTHSIMKNDMFPTRFLTLEFYNGGLCIGSYKNVSMEVVSMNSSTLTDSISFYKYHIFDESQEISEYIIDSEALALKYKIKETY